MTSGFCPQCGTQRTGSLRYCASCGFDFWTAASRGQEKAPTSERGTGAPPNQEPTQPGETAPAQGGSKGGSRLLIALILILAAVGAIAYVAQGGNLASLFGGGGGGANAGDVPPAGVVWFGDSFDPDTFAIRHRVTTVGTNDGFVLVAHLSRSVDASDIAIRVSFNGTLITTQSINSSDSGEVWGVQGGPLYQAGTWKYEFTDIGGNVLASGQITAT